MRAGVPKPCAMAALPETSYRGVSYPQGKLLFSRSVVSDSLWPHKLQHARLPCTSLSPAFAQTPVRGCHPTISSCVTSVSSCPQSFPVSGSFPMNWLFALGGQSIGASASAPVLPVNIQIRAAGSPALRIRLPSSEPDRYLSILSSSFPPHKLRPSLGKRGRKDRANLLTDQVKVQKSLCLKP